MKSTRNKTRKRSSCGPLVVLMIFPHFRHLHPLGRVVVCIEKETRNVHFSVTGNGFQFQTYNNTGEGARFPRGGAGSPKPGSGSPRRPTGSTTTILLIMVIISEVVLHFIQDRSLLFAAWWGDRQNPLPQLICICG